MTRASADALSGFKKDCLRSAALFSGRDPVFLEKLTEYLQLETFGCGTTILNLGQIGDKMYFLHRGEVEVLAGPEQKRVATLGSGSVFGEMALFGTQKRTATVRAMEFCDCRSIHHHAFQSILKNFPAEQRFFENMYEDRKERLNQASERKSLHRRRSSGFFFSPELVNPGRKSATRKSETAAATVKTEEPPSPRRGSMPVESRDRGVEDGKCGSSGTIHQRLAASSRDSVGFYTGSLVLNDLSLAGLDIRDPGTVSVGSGLTDGDTESSGMSEGGSAESSGSSRAGTPRLHLPELVRALPTQSETRTVLQEGFHHVRSEGCATEASDAAASQSNFSVFSQSIGAGSCSLPTQPECPGRGGPGRSAAAAVAAALPQPADVRELATGQNDAVTQIVAVPGPAKPLKATFMSSHSSSSRSPMSFKFNSKEPMPTLSPNSSYTSLRSAVVGRLRGKYSPPKSPSELEEEQLDLTWNSAMELKGQVLKQYPRPPKALFDKLKHDNAALCSAVQLLKQQTAGSRRQPVLLGRKNVCVYVGRRRKSSCHLPPL